MIRFILYVILFYLIYSVAKKVVAFFSQPKSEVKGSPQKKVKIFNPEDIEDIDYKEVEKNHDSSK